MVFFAHVVEKRSFTAAAQKLGVSKSVVSERVKQLEERLGEPLIHRTTRKLAITPEGMAVYERCARLLAVADEVSERESAGDEPRGLLRINAPILFAQEYLAVPLARYIARYPDVRIELSLSDKTIDLLEENIDVAVRIAPRLQGSNLIARKLASDNTVLCAAPSYLERKGTPEAPEDLLQHDCMIYSNVKISEEWRFRKAQSKEVFSVPIEGRFAAASGALLRSAALEGMGLVVLPTFMVHRDLRAGRLRRVIDSFAGIELGIYAVYPEARRQPNKVKALVSILIEHFRKPAWKNS